MADKLKALRRENKELKKLLAKAKELLLTYHDILKKPENLVAAPEASEKKRVPPKNKTAKKTNSKTRSKTKSKTKSKPAKTPAADG